jgi:hypothetical protein
LSSCRAVCVVRGGGGWREGGMRRGGCLKAFWRRQAMTELAFLDKHCKGLCQCVLCWDGEDKDDESKAHLYCVVRWLSSVSSCARGRAEREAEAKKVGRHLSFSTLTQDSSTVL